MVILFYYSFKLNAYIKVFHFYSKRLSLSFDKAISLSI